MQQLCYTILLFKWVAIENKRVIVMGDLESVEEARKKTGKSIPLIFVEGGSHIY